MNSTRETPSSDLVDQAAGYGRWNLVIGLVQRGAPISTTGRTPLHLAAGAGELEVVKTLLDHGADPAATDPEFHATPRQWAEFLHHPPVAEYLREYAAAQTTVSKSRETTDRPALASAGCGNCRSSSRPTRRPKTTSRASPRGGCPDACRRSDARASARARRAPSTRGYRCRIHVGPSPRHRDGAAGVCWHIPPDPA